MSIVRPSRISRWSSIIAALMIDCSMMVNMVESAGLDRELLLILRVFRVYINHSKPTPPTWVGVLIYGLVVF